MNALAPAERRRSDDTVTDMLRDQIAEAKGLAREAKEGSDLHVEYCARLQKWQIVIGCVILLLVEGHSPEAAKLVELVAKAILP